MAAIYDEQGNYVGDDGAPSLDQMKLELVKKNQPLSAQIPGYDRPIPQAQTKPDPLGSAAGNFTELATKFNPLMMAKSMREAAGIVTVPAVAAVKGVGESILTSPAGTYTSGKAPAYAEQVAKQFMEQNAPQTPMTQGFAGAIAPYMAELPAYLGHLSTGRPALTPNDLRVMGAEATRVGRQVRDIPTDFANAQSGLQKLDPITGQPTYGAKLQGVAESVGDIAAARRAEGKSLIPGIPDVVTPETSLYAVRPQGSRLTRPIAPEGSQNLRSWDKDVLDEVNMAPMTPSKAWNLIEQNVLVGGQPRIAFRKYLEDKYKELYPDAPTVGDAKDAFEMLYKDRDTRAAKILSIYDEFLQSPEGAAAGASNLLNASDIKQRHDAATQWLNTNLVNYIQKNVGAEGDPLVKLASEGLTYLPSTKYMDALQSDSGRRLVEQNRRAGNMPLEGTLAEPIAKKQAEFAEAQSKVRDFEARRQSLADIAMRQGLVDPAQIPEYAALTNPLRNAIRERDKIEDQLDNLKVGQAYESAADYGVTPMTAEDFLGRHLEYGERQFYPSVLKTPPQEKVYRTYGSHMDALGLNTLARDFYEEVLAGDIPVDKVSKMTVENYVRNTAKTRLEEERRAKEAAKTYKRDVEQTLQQRARDAIPNDKVFGNAGVIELTKDTPLPQIIRTMSEDTTILDHCVGQGGRASPDDRNPWFGNEHRIYEPLLDPITGRPNPRASRDTTSYVEHVQNGDKIVSVRDISTGMPVATLHLETSHMGNQGQQKYNVGYASGYQNNDIDPKYSTAIKDYMNSIADEINEPGGNLSTHANVFDRQADNFKNAMRQRLNVGKQQFDKYDFSNLPRFVTPTDVRAAMKAADLADASPLKSEMVELNAAIEDAMQEHADLMRMSRRRPFDEDDRTHVAELEASINTMRQRLEDLAQQSIAATAPAPAPATQRHVEYRAPSQAEASSIISRLDDIGNQQMFTLRNEAGETAREMFMNTYATLARENGLQGVTIDNLPDFGRSLQSLRNDLDVQIEGLNMMGFEGRAAATALENVGNVIDRHIAELTVEPPDNAAAVADALMAEPEPAPRAIAAEGEPMPTNMDSQDILARYRDRLTPEQEQYLREFTQRWENTNYPDALTEEYNRWLQNNRLLPATGPAYSQMVQDAVQTLTRQMGYEAGNEMGAAIRAITNVVGIDPVNDTMQFVHELRLAADDAARGTVEIALHDLANDIENMYMQDQENEAAPPAPARPADLDNQRNDRMIEIENMLNDPEADADALRRMANNIGNPLTREANNHWLSLDADARRTAATQLQQRANYIEFSAADFAQRLAAEADLDIPDLRDTVQALDNGTFDHEILRGLPELERNRAAHRTALHLNQIIQTEEAVAGANRPAIADRNPIRDTVRNAAMGVLQGALTPGERTGVSAAIRNLMFDNNDFHGEEGANEARTLAQTIREYAIGPAENMTQVERELVARELDSIADERELGIGNQRPEVVRALEQDLAMPELLTQITQMDNDTGGVWRRVNGNVSRALGIARRQGAEANAVGRAIRQGIYMDPDTTPIEREYIARVVVANLREDEAYANRNQPPEGNAEGGPVRGYQAGGSVKKPEVKTPWLFSVPTYSETVAYEMYPGQKGQDDQRDAARHMLAAGTLSRKYGPGVAEFLGKAHEYVTSPLQAVKTLFGGQMPADYGMDTHNNAVGAQLGQRAKSQAELEDLVQAEAERASRTQTPGQAFIKKANGGIVQQNPTTDQMRYALMMRRK